MNQIFNQNLYKLRQKIAFRNTDKYESAFFLRSYVNSVVADKIEEIRLIYPEMPARRILLICQCAKSIDFFRGIFKDSDVMVHDASTLGGFDVIISVFNLHTVNDVLGELVKARNSLNPGGLFIATFPGGYTLKELRASLGYAEEKYYGGLSPRVHPMIDVKDAGLLAQKAGFTMPVADNFNLMVNYSNPSKLISDLRDMGESNVMQQRSGKLLRPKVIADAMDYYRNTFANNEGKCPATFEVITITGRG